jgi:hypothetical protein
VSEGDGKLDLERIVEEVAPQVRERVKAQVVERISTSLTYSLEQRISQTVQQYVEDHVLADVQKQLEDSHDQIVQAICESVAVACEQLRNALIDHVTNRLADKYKAEKIAEAIFGSRY